MHNFLLKIPWRYLYTICFFWYNLYKLLFFTRQSKLVKNLTTKVKNEEKKHKILREENDVSLFTRNLIYSNRKVLLCGKMEEHPIM